MQIAKTFYDCLRVDSGLKEFSDTIIKNSWVVQKDLAIGGALALFSTLACRKFIFHNLSPNLYILEIAESGSGKSFPQEQIKRTLADCGGEHLLGPGDYASYAGLMDSLSTKPVRLDILDEMGGIIRGVTSTGDGHLSKTDDLLAELFTSSNSYYAGRALAEGTKGQCFRPNVNILGATTPTGFEESVSQAAFDKGLLGRFLFLFGNPDIPSTRVKSISNISEKLKQHIQWLISYRPEDNSNIKVKGIEQAVTEIQCDKQSDLMIEEIFTEFDKLRLSVKGSPISPVASRLFQQASKLMLIHAISRSTREIPVIDKHDALFAYEFMLLQYRELDKVVGRLVFSSNEEKDRAYVLQEIKNRGTIDKSTLVRSTPKIGRNKRVQIIEELKDLGDIVEDAERLDDNSIKINYIYVGYGR